MGSLSEELASKLMTKDEETEKKENSDFYSVERLNLVDIVI